MSLTFLNSLSDSERTNFIDGVFNLVRSGQLDPLTEMLDSGVPVNLVNAKNDSLLTIAAYNQKPEIVQELLARHADTNIENSMGQTAISCAVFRRDEEILKKLLAAGGDPDLGARTALEIAQQFGLVGMEKVLTEFSAAQQG